MIRVSVDALKRFLLGRQVAYCRVFDRQSPFTDEVLADLAKFCRAYETTFQKDPRAHALLEGRREVFFRIADQLNLDIEDIYKLRGIKTHELGE